jgi:hypothetical protein
MTGFFRLFAAAKNLYLSTEFSPRIAPALQNIFGANREKGDRSVTHLAESFLGGSAIRTCPRNHWKVLRRTTALRTPYDRFFLGKIMVRHVVSVGGQLLMNFSLCSIISYQRSEPSTYTPLFFYCLPCEAYFYLELLGSDILYYDHLDCRQYVASGKLELGSVDQVPKKTRDGVSDQHIISTYKLSKAFPRPRWIRQEKRGLLFAFHFCTFCGGTSKQTFCLHQPYVGDLSVC